MAQAAPHGVERGHGSTPSPAAVAVCERLAAHAAVAGAQVVTAADGAQPGVLVEVVTVDQYDPSLDDFKRVSSTLPTPLTDMMCGYVCTATAAVVGDHPPPSDAPCDDVEAYLDWLCSASTLLPTVAAAVKVVMARRRRYIATHLHEFSPPPPPPLPPPAHDDLQPPVLRATPRPGKGGTGEADSTHSAVSWDSSSSTGTGVGSRGRCTPPPPPGPPAASTSTPVCGFLRNMMSVDEVSAVLRQPSWLAGSTHFLRTVQCGPHGLWEESDFVHRHEVECVAEEVPFRASPMFMESRCSCDTCAAARPTPSSVHALLSCDAWSAAHSCHAAPEASALGRPIAADVHNHFMVYLPLRVCVCDGPVAGAGACGRDAPTLVNVLFLLNSMHDSTLHQPHALEVFHRVFPSSPL